MAHPQITPPKKDNSMLLALMLFLGAGVLLLFTLMPDGKSGKDSVISVQTSKKYEDNVNRYLMLTNQKIELQRQRMMVENNALAPDYQDTKGTKAYQNSENGVDLSGDGQADAVARELGRANEEGASPQTPNELIQKEIFNQQQYQEYSAAYKQEYARQFVDNAARHGWAVKLNDDFKVISVKQIRNPSSQMELFNSGGGSGQ